MFRHGMFVYTNLFTLNSSSTESSYIKDWLCNSTLNLTINEYSKISNFNLSTSDIKKLKQSNNSLFIDRNRVLKKLFSFIDYVFAGLAASFDCISI